MDMSSCLASACSEGFVKGLEARVGNSTAQVCYKAYIDSKQYELYMLRGRSVKPVRLSV